MVGVKLNVRLDGGSEMSGGDTRKRLGSSAGCHVVEEEEEDRMEVGWAPEW